jgi:hypothetical protein
VVNAEGVYSIQWQWRPVCGFGRPFAVLHSLASGPLFHD